MTYSDIFKEKTENMNTEFDQTLTYEDTLLVREELASLILPNDEASAVRFDELMYGIELALLVGKKYGKARSDLYKRGSGIASI